MSTARQINEVALLIWSGLLGALKADGLIAATIETSGVNTTKFLTMLALDNVMKESSLTWIPVAIGPNPTHEVFAISTKHPEWEGDILKFHPGHKIWLTREGAIVNDVTHYCVIPKRDGAMVPT